MFYNSFPHAQGYVKHTVNPSNGASEFDYVYQYKDHLGNIRINYTFDPATSSLRVLEENHYYPFGLKHQENLQPRSIRFTPSPIISNEWVKGVGYLEPPPPMAALVPNSGYQNKYNGKSWENELDLNLYDYGARNYDPSLGRWMNIDPLAEKHDSYTPYNYAINSPIFVIDPDGMDIRFASWKDVQNDDELKKQYSSRKEYRQAKRELKRELREVRKKSETANKIYTDLENDSNTHTIYATKSTGGSTVAKEGGGTNIKIGVGVGDYVDGITSKESNIKALIGHEGGHAWLKMNGLEVEYKLPAFDKAMAFEVKAYNKQYENRERAASHIENIIRGELINNGVGSMSLSSNYHGRVLNYTGGSFSKYELKTTTFELLNNNPYNSEGYLNQTYKLPIVKE